MSQPQDLLDFIPYADGGRMGAPEPVTTCPHCQRTEPNEVLLRNNHWVDSTRVQESGICIAMDLTLSHITYWSGVIAGTMPAPPRVRPKISPHEQLQRALRRAEVVWQHRLPELHARLPEELTDPASAHECVNGLDRAPGRERAQPNAPGAPIRPRTPDR